MARRTRLDAELVRRGLAADTGGAAEMVRAGRITVGGLIATNPATAVDRAAALVVVEPAGDEPAYASRGGHKLAGALDAFGDLTVAGRRCLDAGASTGGFTDVLLRRGAREVVAVDVGYGELAWRLRTDDRVRVLERVNARTLTAEAIGGAVDLVVADLSFISLATVLPALAGCARGDGDLLPMVKPQFEVARDRTDAGVVRDPATRAEAVLTVADAAGRLGLGVAGVTASPLPGPSGNVEFFLWLRADAPPVDPERVYAAVGRERGRP